MPQAVSIFPAPPPKSNSTPANQSNGDSTSSRFGDVLNDVQKKDSSASAPSSTPTKDTADKSAKPAKDAKAAKSARGKVPDATTDGNTKDAGQPPAPESDPATLGKEPVIALADPGVPAPAAKPNDKDAAKTASDQTIAAVDPNAVQPPVVALKKPGNLPQDKPASDSSSDGNASKTKSAAQSVDPTQAVTVAQSPGGADSSTPVDPHAASPSAKPARPNATARPADQPPQGAVGLQPDAATTTNGVLPANQTTSSSTASIDDAAALDSVEPAPVDAKTPAPQHVASQGFAELLGAAQGPAPAPAGLRRPRIRPLRRRV